MVGDGRWLRSVNGPVSRKVVMVRGTIPRCQSQRRRNRVVGVSVLNWAVMANGSPPFFVSDQRLQVSLIFGLPLIGIESSDTRSKDAVHVVQSRR